MSTTRFTLAGIVAALAFGLGMTPSIKAQQAETAEDVPHATLGRWGGWSGGLRIEIAVEEVRDKETVIGSRCVVFGHKGMRGSRLEYSGATAPYPHVVMWREERWRQEDRHLSIRRMPGDRHARWGVRIRGDGKATEPMKRMSDSVSFCTDRFVHDAPLPQETGAADATAAGHQGLIGVWEGNWDGSQRLPVHERSHAGLVIDGIARDGTVTGRFCVRWAMDGDGDGRDGEIWLYDLHRNAFRSKVDDKGAFEFKIPLPDRTGDPRLRRQVLPVQARSMGGES